MKPKLLIVDDQVMYGRSLDRALRSDFSIVVATTVQGAQQSKGENLSCALVDIRLDEAKPDDRQGLEFIRWLRERKPHIPIVAMSAIEEESLEDEALKAGATRFLRKPIGISRLKELLQELQK